MVIICNFYSERHVHLYSDVYGMYNIYKVITDGCQMSKGMVTVEDNTKESKIASMCLY